MSWIPAFKLDLWNAWILMLYFPLHLPFIKLLDKAIGTGDIFKKLGAETYEKQDKQE